MADVYDRWHKSRPKEGEARCEHDRVPTADHGKGKRWQARWRDADGKQCKENFDRKAAAEARAQGAGSDVRRGEYIDAAAGRVTFKDYAEDWRASRPHRATTRKAVEQHLRCYAYPAFGARRLSSIRPTQIQAWVTSLTSNGLAPSTTRTVFNTVRAVFRAAVQDRVIARSPCDGVKTPAIPRRQVVPLTVPQVNALARAVPVRYRALVITGAGTGLRPGELFGLQVRDVDFLRRTLRVERQLQQTAGHGVYACPPKTARSHRTVPLPKVVVDALAAHLKSYPVASQDDYVFRMQQGGPVVRTAFYDSVWRQAVSSAGLPKGTGMHALRHAYASLLIAGGESVKVVSERLGHTNAAMTLNTYSHLFPDTEEKTRKAIDAAFATPSAPDVPSTGA